MKKGILILAACLLVAFGLPALADDAPFLNQMAMEYDSAAFAQATQAVNWQIPQGYTLESFLRGDLTNDGHVDSVVASLLGADGVTRTLVVIIANPFDQHIYTCPNALPPKGGEGSILGFSANPGYFSIHTGENGQTSRHASYTFGYHGGRFYLDKVYVDQWGESMTGTEQVFQLDIGHYEARQGRVDGGVFTTESVTAQHDFDENRTVFLLEQFDHAAFPLDWDAFNTLIGGRATPAPRPTSRPRPTYGPIPDPVYPSEMPGPVYPTDMPGPVYPTEEPIPDPVYPTDEPGPIYGDADGGE